MIQQLEDFLDDIVRPGLANHGGDIELVDIEDYKMFIKLTGGCQGCSSSIATVKQGIENLIKENFELIEEIVDVTDHTQGDNPYM